MPPPVTPAEMLALKLLLVPFIAMVGYHAIGLRTTGRSLALFRGSRASPGYQSLLEDKRSKWYCMTSNILIAVLGIEMLVNASPHGRHYPAIFPIHLATAMGFAVLVGVLRWQTGIRSRIFHRRAGYTALGLLLVAVGTGGFLIAQL